MTTAIPGETAILEHLTDNEFERVYAYLSRTLGLNMRSKRVLLDCRLSRERDRLKLPSFSAYLDLIESGTNPEATARFIDLVTTHYTYFLRERRQFDFLLTTAFPELEASRPRRTWNILCAGCSTGEECYTVSMLVEDYGRSHDIPPVRITGVDISKGAIEKACRAIYQPAHVEKVPQHWLSSYFDHDDGNYTVTGPVRRRVTFVQANLNDPDALRRHYDLIMCRNVIIYFDRKTRERVLDNLHSHLSVSGYLILGHSEIIRSRTKFVYLKDSVYQKQPEAIIS